MSTITDRKESTIQVRSTGRRFARMTARALGEEFTPALTEGRHLPDFEHAQELAVATLEMRWQQLSAADETAIEAAERRSELVVERNAATSRLYREVGHLRMVLEGIFGAAPAARLIGLPGATSQDPVKLLRQADRAVARLRDLSRALPPSRRQRSAADRERWAAPVASASRLLHHLVTGVTRAAKELDAARLERRQALEDFNGSFVRLAGLMAAVYRAAERDDLADAIRPSKQYPGLTDRLAKRRLAKRSAKRRDSRPPVSVRLLSFPRLRPILRLFDSRRRSS